MPGLFDEDFSQTFSPDQWQQMQQTSPSDVSIVAPGQTQFTADTQPNAAALSQRVAAGVQPLTEGGTDWLTKIGHLLSSTAAGIKGDPYYMQRVQAAEQQKRQQEENIKLKRSEIGIHALQQMKALSELVGDDPAKAAQAAKIIKPAFDMGAGTEFKEEDIAKLLTQPDNIEALTKFYPEIAKTGGLDPQTKQLIKQGKISLEVLARHAQTQLGQSAFQKIYDLAKNGVINKDVDEATLQQLLPDTKYLTDEQKNQLNDVLPNVMSKALREKQKEAQIEKTTPDLRSTLTVAKLLTGKDVNSVAELTPQEQQDVLRYKNSTPAVQEQLNNLLLKNKGKTVTDLYDEAIKEADKRSTAKAVNIGVSIAGGGAQARADVAATGPIKPEKASNYVKLTGESPQGDPNIKSAKDMTPDKLREAGYRYLPEERLRGFHASQIALQQVDRIEKMGEQLFKGVGKGENLGNALKLKGNAVLGDANVRAFQAIINETLPTNAVASGLTPGRVGENIIEHVERPIMPNDTDTYASFKAKIATMKQRFKNNMNVHFGLGIPANLVTDESGGGAQQGGGAGEQPRRAVNSQTGEIVEWNGKAWVKVK